MDERVDRPEGLSNEVWVTVCEAEKVLTGETTDKVPEMAGEAEFSGLILDENVVSELERDYVLRWLSKVMGESIDDLLVKQHLISSDGMTKVTVYDKPVGVVEYYLSKWINEGEKPSYILWPWTMYEGQLGAGYEEESA